jgi:hypothetical protein
MVFKRIVWIGLLALLAACSQQIGEVPDEALVEETEPALDAVRAAYPGYTGRVSDIELSASGNPVVATGEADTTQGKYYVRVRRNSYGSWKTFGSRFAVAGAENVPSPYMALKASGHPFVVYREGTSAVVREWKGTSKGWVKYGSVAGNPKAIAVDANDQPYVLVESNTLSSLGLPKSVSVHSGSNLKAMATIDATADGYYAVSRMILDSEGNPLVAWTRKENDAFVLVLWRLEGSVWAPLGRIAAPQGFMVVRPTDLALDGSGNALVGWIADRNGNPAPGGQNEAVAGVSKQEGKALVQLGGNIGNDFNPNTLRIGVDGEGAVYAAWTSVVGFSKTGGAAKWAGKVWSLAKAQMPVQDAEVDADGNLFVADYAPAAETYLFKSSLKTLSNF